MKSVSMTATTLTGIAVLGLWVLSWALSGVDLGAWSLPVALIIAAVKAILVVLFFMELVVEKPSVHATAFTGLAMIGIMIAFMIMDVRTRATTEVAPFEADLSHHH